MKDLDFDELDKAVSTLMADGSFDKQVEEAPHSDEQVLTIDTSAVDDSSNNLNKPVPSGNTAPKTDDVATQQEDMSVQKSPTSANETPPTPASATPQVRQVPERTRVEAPAVKRRSSGRFMDVVHSSSDMKNSRPTVPSRTGISITPPNPAPSQPSTNLSDVAKDIGQDSVQASTPYNQTVSSTGSPTETAWPDPIDLAGKDEDYIVNGDSGEQESDVEPLTSPFLAGAKVEKRPLGGAPSGDNYDYVPENTTDISDNPEDQLPVSIEPQLPQELRDELLAVESDDSSSAAQSQPVEEHREPTNQNQAIEASSQQVSSSPTITSIQQQYKTEPNVDSNDDTADIFDTKDYHQPLSHPAKKKSGWLWVVWIILLILLGASAGAAMYLFVL